jgi:hypothetical protein
VSRMVCCHPRGSASRPPSGPRVAVVRFGPMTRCSLSPARLVRGSCLDCAFRDQRRRGRATDFGRTDTIEPWLWSVCYRKTAQPLDGGLGPDPGGFPPHPRRRGGSEAAVFLVQFVRAVPGPGQVVLSYRRVPRLFDPAFTWRAAAEMETQIKGAVWASCPEQIGADRNPSATPARNPYSVVISPYRQGV